MSKRLNILRQLGFLFNLTLMMKLKIASKASLSVVAVHLNEQ